MKHGWFDWDAQTTALDDTFCVWYFIKFCKNEVRGGVEKFWGERSDFIFHLNNFKKILLAHVKLEDAEFYPVLAKAEDEKTKETAKKYSDEIKLISKRAVSFFETYAHLKVDDLLQNEYFKLDLNTIVTIIKRRIDLEEAELYPLYNKIK